MVHILTSDTVFVSKTIDVFENAFVLHNIIIVLSRHKHKIYI